MASIASPEEVAEAGLARLPLGPVHNRGLEDEAARSTGKGDSA